MDNRASEKYQGERYLQSWDALPGLGDGTIYRACYLWAVASYAITGTVPLSEWQRLWWMFRRYQMELVLEDLDEPDDKIIRHRASLCTRGVT